MTTTSNDDRRRAGTTTTTPDDNQPMPTDDGAKQATGTTQGKTAGDSENATSRRQRGQASKNEGTARENNTDPIERIQRQATGATEIAPPADAIDTASNEHPSRGADPPCSRPSNGKQHDAATETQTAIAPPHLSNGRGAERYDDGSGTDSKQTRRRRRRKARTRSYETRMTGQARKSTSHEQPPDDDNTTTPRPACRKNGARNETRTGTHGLIQFVLIAYRGKSRGVLSVTKPRAVFASSPQTARGTRGRRGTHTVHMKNENPISE